MFARITLLICCPADFHAGLWSGTQEQRDFTLVTDGLWKIDLPWHLTPFHEESLDLFLLQSKAGWCLRCSSKTLQVWLALCCNTVYAHTEIRAAMQRCWRLRHMGACSCKRLNCCSSTNHWPGTVGICFTYVFTTDNWVDTFRLSSS